MQLPPPWGPKWFHLIDGPIDLRRQDTQVELEKWKQFFFSSDRQKTICLIFHSLSAGYDLICEQTTENINHACQDINCVKFSPRWIARLWCRSDMFRKRKPRKFSPTRSTLSEFEEKTSTTAKRVLLKKKISFLSFYDWVTCQKHLLLVRQRSYDFTVTVKNIIH